MGLLKGSASGRRCGGVCGHFALEKTSKFQRCNVIDILAQGRYGAAKREYYFQSDDYEYVLAPFRDGCKSCIWIPNR
jgi:hypothetical protein